MDDTPTSSSVDLLPTRLLGLRRNRKRLLVSLLAVLAVLGFGYWWLFVRLNSLECQLIGTREGIRMRDTGATVTLSCEPRADRTAIVEFRM